MPNHIPLLARMDVSLLLAQEKFVYTPRLVGFRGSRDSLLGLVEPLERAFIFFSIPTRLEVCITPSLFVV